MISRGESAHDSPPKSEELAALTMASTERVVMSPWMAFISG